MADAPHDTRDLSRATVGGAFGMLSGPPVPRPQVTLTLTDDLREPDGRWPDLLSTVAGDVALGLVSYTGGAGPTNRAPAAEELPSRAITNVYSIDFVADLPPESGYLFATAEPVVRRGHDVLRVGEVRADGETIVARASSWWHVIEGGHDPRRVASERREAAEAEAPEPSIELPESVAAKCDIAELDPERSPIARHLGLHLTRADAAQADLWLREPQRFRNSGGTLFGGACALLALYGAQAAVMANAPGARMIAMNATMNFLRPAGGGTAPVPCVGHVIRVGRNTAHAGATIFTPDGKPAMVATLTASLMPRA